MKITKTLKNTIKMISSPTFAFVVATTLQSGSARNVVRDSLAIAESLVDAGTLLSKRPTSFLRSRTNVGSH